MAETKIEWVIGPDGSRGHSVNPIRFRNIETGKVGHFCEKISAGCKNCYSSTMQKPYLSGLEFIAENRDKGELFLDDAALESVLRRRKPTGYFWCDMTDLFGSWVPDAWIDKCFAAMALTPHHRHYVLTKRADRMREYFAEELMGRGARQRVYNRSYALSAIWQAATSVQWPLPDVWLGVSVEDQKTADERIPHLLATPAAVRFLSVEPLLGPVDISRWLKPEHWTGGGLDEYGPGAYYHREDCPCNGTGVMPQDLHWVILGGESGPGARPCRLEWIRAIVRQCAEAGVPCFVKQLGTAWVRDGWQMSHATGETWAGKKGNNPDHWPPDLNVRQYPEVARG